jgi:glycosyltransferase involved in cell wall biosynthesis
MALFEEGLVSIIIPVFNREKLLPETLDSVLSQIYKKWECIIIDDGSTDGSMNIAKEYANKDIRIKAYRRPLYKKKGANTCRNYGFELSQGEFIQWFDSDDLMDSNMLQNAINILNTDGFDMAFVNAGYFEEKKDNLISKSSFFVEKSEDNLAFKYLTLKIFFQTSQVIFRHKTLLYLNKTFNDRLNRNQETQFFISLLLRDIKLSAIKDVLVYIRIHDKSITSKYQAMKIADKYIVDFEAFRQIYIDFIGTKYLTQEVKSHFSEMFFKSLKKANPKNINYFKIYLFGNKYGLFPSFFVSTKIFLSRTFKNV